MTCTQTPAVYYTRARSACCIMPAPSQRADDPLSGSQGVKFDLKLPPKCKLIAQPPADLAEGDAAMLHYTWGSIWKDDAGKEVWSFDKRFYTDAKLELEVTLVEACVVCSCLAVSPLNP